MIGSYNLANNDNNVQVFYTIGTGLWQTWQKPKGYKFAQFIVIGGGGGGGAGASSVGTSKSGGAGGGSSGVSRIFITLSNIPDVLYVQVGEGGLGGTIAAGNGNPGSPGQLSYISIQPNTAVANVLIASGNAASGGGSGGTVASTNAIAGAASTVFTVANGLLSHNGHFNFVAGQSGQSGGNQNQSGGVITLAGITSGGAGGAGATTISGIRNGANVTGASFIPTISGGSSTSQASNGFSSFNDKIFNMKTPLFFTGGGGGFSNSSGTGGYGGNGAFGCGGGGGGGGNIGERGGNGGNGLIIITCW